MGWPLLAPLSGAAWTQAETFAVMPDPTALATLGLMLLAQRPPWWLFVVPVLSCALGGALSWALQAPAPWLAPALAVVAVVCAWRCPRARGSAAVP
jgi:membrane protein YqaA with SNARE-associated domain